MKRVILTTVMIAGISIAVSAQTGGNHSTGSSGTVRTAGKSAPKSRSAKGSRARNGKATKGAKLKPGSPQLSERKIYHWTNGQRATPTGTEATSSNGNGFASLKKDTTAVKKKDEQQ